MADMIRNYACGHRQAIIKKEETAGNPSNMNRETMIVGKHTAVFQSDGASFSIDDTLYTIFDNLSDGDIVEINERGVLNRTFCYKDSDATIFMTGNCNSNCVMCPASDYERKANYGNRRQTIVEYISMLPPDLRNYVVTGGEPTLNPKLFLDTMKLLSERFPKAEGLLLTNGRSFSVLPFLVDMLEHCPPYLTVAIPLHGSTAELHDEITRVQGSFRQTVRGIYYLLTRHVSVEIRIVVTKVNYRDIIGLCRMIAHTFPSTCRVNFISLEVRGNCYSNRERVYISPKASFQASKEGIKILMGQGIDVGLYNYPLCCVEPGYQFLCKKSISYEKVRYALECERCKIRENCGGVFVSTLKTVHPELYPYR